VSEDHKYHNTEVLNSRLVISLPLQVSLTCICLYRTNCRTGGGFTSTFVAQRLLTCLQSTEAWRSAISSSSVTASAVTTSSSSYSSNSSSSSSTTAAVAVAEQLSPAAVTAALQCAFLAVDALLEVQPRMALHEQDSSEDGKRYKASDSSGSTGIVAAVLPGFVAVANAGDSRAIIVQPQQVQLSSSGRGSVDVSVTALSEVRLITSIYIQYVHAVHNMHLRCLMFNGLLWHSS
jgi:Protein phosphatase 2C